MTPKQRMTFQFSQFEEELMRKLIELAKARKGFTHPNPVVAAAVYKDQSTISIGVHQKAGLDHAEVIALKEAGSLAKGASIMITLEPCTHYGGTPPCTKIIKNRVKACGRYFLSLGLSSRKFPSPKFKFLILIILLK